MVGELITLPLRVGIRATQLWLQAAEETVSVVAGVTGRLIGNPLSRGTETRATRIAPRDTDIVQDEPIDARTAPAGDTSAPPASTATRDELGPEPDQPAAEPAHVSEEPELVEEIAEPGAEDGAGAAVHVEAPWEGYDHMKAADVIERLSGASSAELAAIQLYESETKGRSTVLEAVERELRISTGSGSQS